MTLLHDSSALQSADYANNNHDHDHHHNHDLTNDHYNGLPA